MKVTVIGAGNAHSRINGNTCFMVEETDSQGSNHILMIDYGRTVPDELHRRGIDIKSIEAVYISHAHSDHCGGLEDLGLLRYDWVNKPQRWDDYNTHKFADGRIKPYWKNNIAYRQYAPKLIANESLMSELWNETLCGGMATMEGFPSTLETFFEPRPVAPNEVINWYGWDIRLVQQVHVMTGSMTKSSFGIIFSRPGCSTVYFTTDSQHCSPEQMEVFYKEADVIFQDCELIGCDMRYREGEPTDYDKEGNPIAFAKCFKYTSKVHANYCKLAGYPSANAIRLDTATKNKMLLCHYQDFKLLNKIDPAIDPNFTFNWDAQAEEDGFAGFVNAGDVFYFTPETKMEK